MIRVQHWCGVRLSLTNRPNVSRKFRHCDRRDCRFIRGCHFVRVCCTARRVDFRRNYRRCRDCCHRRYFPPNIRASVDRSFNFRRCLAVATLRIEVVHSNRLLQFLMF